MKALKILLVSIILSLGIGSCFACSEDSNSDYAVTIESSYQSLKWLELLIKILGLS